MCPHPRCQGMSRASTGVGVQRGDGPMAGPQHTPHRLSNRRGVWRLGNQTGKYPPRGRMVARRLRKRTQGCSWKAPSPEDPIPNCIKVAKAQGPVPCESLPGMPSHSLSWPEPAYPSRAGTNTAPWSLSETPDCCFCSQWNNIPYVHTLLSVHQTMITFLLGPEPECLFPVPLHRSGDILQFWAPLSGLDPRGIHNSLSSLLFPPARKWRSQQKWVTRWKEPRFLSHPPEEATQGTHVTCSGRCKRKKLICTMLAH